MCSSLSEFKVKRLYAYLQNSSSTEAKADGAFRERSFSLGGQEVIPSRCRTWLRGVQKIIQEITKSFLKSMQPPPQKNIFQLLLPWLMYIYVILSEGKLANICFNHRETAGRSKVDFKTSAGEDADCEATFHIRALFEPFRGR